MSSTRKRHTIKCWFDGSCDSDAEGGDMGIGALIKVDDKIVFEYADFVPASPDNTSNLAEYSALLAVLNYLHFKNYLCGNHDIKIFGDCKMVIEQMNGRLRMKVSSYLRTATHCKEIMMRYGNRGAKIIWHPREWNREADALSKSIIRERKFNIKTNIK
jgi:ribonuclease HI